MLSSEEKMKLELIRVDGIKKLLLTKVDPEDLKNRIYALTKVEVKELKKYLGKISRSILIRLIEMSQEISKTDIEETYEEYRYGYKPGFTLYYVNNYSSANVVDISYVEDVIIKQLAKEKYLSDEKYKDVKFKSYECFEGIYELCFSYLSKYTYINSEDILDHIYELKEAFVWVSLENKFVAIHNGPKKVEDTIKNTFRDLYGVQICNVKLNNKIIKDIFKEENMRKVSLFNPNAGENQAEKATFADAHMAQKQELLNQYENYNKTSALFSEEIDDQTISTLGLNSQKGKIYTTRNLKVSQFRNWSVRRIKDIISHINTGMSEVDISVVNAIDFDNVECLKNYNVSQKGIIKKIISTLVAYKKSEMDIQPLECLSQEILSGFKDEFYPTIRSYCETCNKICICYCECGSCNLTVIKKTGELVCNDCGKRQSGELRLLCEEGHEFDCSSLNSTVVLLPSRQFMNIVADTIKFYFSDISFDVNLEYFYIFDNSIYFVKSENYEIISPNEVETLDFITSRKISETKYKRLKRILDKLGEKCDKSSNEECNKCTLHNERYCLLKIFSVIEDYRPHPHHGQEFGDVAFNIRHKGRCHVFQGIAKATPSESLTPSSRVGREIIQQFLKGSLDRRVDVLGPICPVKYDEQLMEDLKYLARVSNKKILVWDDIALVKLLDYYLEEKGLKDLLGIAS